MKENKLKMKDVTTIGIFGALLFVITVVIGAVTGINMTVYMFSTAITALVSGPFYMLIVAKVHKRGAIIMTSGIVGILWAVMGGIYVLIWMLILGIIGEVLVSRTNYQNYRMIIVSYALYNTAYYMGAIAPLYYDADYTYSHGNSQEAANALLFAAHSVAAYVAVPVMLAVSVVGAILAKKMLKKHFEKAGVI